MLTSKQRAYLRGLANGLDAFLQIGKGGLSPELTENVRIALEQKELIKLSVLNNCTEEPNELARILSERTLSEVVHVIGKKIVLYKRAKKPMIELPK